VAQVLKDEGFIVGFEVGMEKTDEHGHPAFLKVADVTLPKLVLRVYLKYGPEGERVIRYIQRASRPGRRLYIRADQIRPVLQGLGISIISTNKGVVSDRQARTQRLGGEMLATVW